jgi:chromosomal replication initiation ATPase DnaA
MREWSGLNGLEDWTLETFPGDETARAWARTALECKKGIWVFYSKAFGTGKTGILVAIVNACLDRGVPALYQSVPSMLDRLRSAYENESYEDLLETLKTIPVLALDEFHRFKNTEWAQEKIFQIVDDRYMKWSSRLTLVATNNEMDCAEDDPIVSRFRDSQRSHLIAVSGGDLRPIAKEICEQTLVSKTSKPTRGKSVVVADHKRIRQSVP